MLKSKGQKMITWMTIFVMLFGVIAPNSIARAQAPEIVDNPVEIIDVVNEVGITATPTTLPATVEVTGVDEGGVIDSSASITISVTLPSIPVMGDGGEDYFVHGDTFELLISENFMFDPVPLNQDLMFGGVKVGTVVYSNNALGQAVATIVFDGEPYIFDPSLLPDGEPPYSGVSAEFTCDLVWNNTYEEEENGDEYVVILDKTYDLQIPGEVLTYTVTKDVASVNFAEGTITWSVVITGEKDTVPPTALDLAGFLFSDDLTAVGAYVDDSFMVNGTGFTPDTTAPELTYILPDPSVSPVVITFKTSIPDDVLTNGGTISNNAEVFDGEEEIGSDDASATIVGPSASKTGVADDGFGEGTYDPTDRTITWTVTVDNKGQTLNGLTITDVLQGGLTFESAVWQRYDAATDTWVDVKTWSSEPANGIYEIGDVDYIGRLVIVSNVPDEDADGSVAAKTYNNQASASWTSPGGSPGNAGTGNPGVGIGYNAITKSGTQSDEDKANHQISWTINVDLRGQTTTDFVYYDLFVHDAATSNGALTGAAGWPAGVSIGTNGVNRNNGQKFVGVTSQDGHLTVEVIDLAGLGTLVKVTGLRANGSNQVVLKSQVLDPDILAGNRPAQTVANTASLYKGTTYRGKDSDSVPFANMILGKQMLHRDQVANDHDPLASIDPSNTTSNIGNGFHYDYKEVIFRLNINGAGLDFKDVETNLPGGFGDVTVTDTLPAGWIFTPFADGAEYIIYSADGAYVATVPALDPSTINGFTAVVGTSTATFTFTDLDQPYVILVKARPTDETFDGYLVGGNSHTETNTLNLRTENWTPGKTVTQNVRIDSKLIGKTVNSALANQGILTWTLDYTPIERPIATAIQDVLPEGIDLRLDASGNIIWEQDGARNITVYELTLNANGTYTQGAELSLEALQAAITYDNETRTLRFTFPDNTQAYRFVYVTDITGQPGLVTNQASLVGATGEGTGTGTSFLVTEQHGSATMSRSGFIYLRKTDGPGSILPGAEFTLYNTNPDGSIGSPRAVRTSGSDGTIRIYGLPPGTYILKETQAPSGYFNPTLEFVIVVTEAHLTTINGELMSLQDPIEIINYAVANEAGSLTISKTVEGNGADLDKLFTFTVTFNEAPGVSAVYPYVGNGVPNGTISSGGTIQLKHGQSITIVGLPVGLTYTVTEADYSADGYVVTYTGAEGTIVLNEEQVAAFTNTRNIGSLTINKTVTGNGGDLDKLFSFTVTFGNAPNTYPYTGTGGAADGTISSGDTIQLKHGQSITITDLPVGSTYTVTEADYGPDGYVVSYTGEEGTIDIDETQVAAFTNTRDLGSMSISKTVAGNGGDTTKLFAFTVTFTNAPNTYPYVGSGGAADGTISSGDTINLAHGQSITINDLPVGATYTVVEADYSAEGYELVYTGDTGTIVADEAQVASFTNTRVIDSLTISKTVAGNGGDLTKLFAFTVTFENAPDEYPYVGSGGAADGTIESGDTIYLSHGQSITIANLPIGATYTVVEEDYAPDGYVLTHTGANGTIVLDQIQIAAFTNTREIGSLTISKTVAGNGGDLDKLFSFTVTFVNAPYTYPYVGNGGAADGTITSGDTIQLKHGQSITINDLPKDATYTVVEADYAPEGYVLTHTGANGTIVVDQTQTAAFTNTREIGSLTISKTVVGNGGDLTKLFSFTVTFVNAPYTYPYVGNGGAADGTISSGDTIQLTHGQSITINDLPKDATYTVVEADYSAEGYILTHTGSNGTIVVDETQVAAFTNTREIGSLTISKTVAGNSADLTKLFSFTVTFVNAPYTYPYVGSGGAANGTITSGDTIQLAHGQSITINDLPKDATYTVVEADYSSEWYELVHTGADGTIVVDETQVAAFTNTRNVGFLTISKTVEGNGGDPNKLFSFTVTFENAPGEYPYVGLGGAADGTIKSGDTIYLAHGQSILINDLPKGATYTVVEADYSADGYILTYTGAEGTIDVDEAQVARFTNTREIGSLTISKTVAGNGGDHSKLFAFTVTFENAPYTYPYLGSGGAANGTIKSGDTIYLAHGQSITINDLPKDATYTVVEADYSVDGYILTHTGSNGTIVVDETQVAAFTNTRNVGELIIKKTVTGDLGDRARYFTFVVEFFNDNNRTYQYHGSKSGSIKSGESILLKHDEYVVIEDVLVGTSFKVTEVEAHQHGYGTSFTGTEGVMDTAGKTAAFVNWRSSVPNTGDDNTASIGRLGLMVSIPLLLVSSGVYGVLEAKKRKKNLS